MGWWRNRYGFPPKSRPRRIDGGIKTRSQRGAIGETWWSRRWIEVLESFDIGARLNRGRSYARQGQVVRVTIQPGEVAALVQGSRSKPYAVTIRLKPLSDKDWSRVTEAMAARAIFAARLLAGEMPQNIEEAFSAVRRPLMPASSRELVTECSCPDWSNPCKHIAAVYYILAERFDDDPFMIFTLRGRTKDQIIENLRAKRATSEPETKTSTVANQGAAVPPAQEQPAPPLESSLETFWQAGPQLETFVTHRPAPDVDQATLKRLGSAPFDTDGQLVGEFLERAYAAATSAASRMAAEDRVED